MQVNDGSGNCLYTTQKNPPFIQDIQTALLSTDPVPAVSDLPLGNPVLLRNLTTSVVSYDGGRPFVSAFTFTLADWIAGSAWQQPVSLGGNWSNSTTLGIYWYTTARSGSNPASSSPNQTGQWPRDIIFIK